MRDVWTTYSSKYGRVNKPKVHTSDQAKLDTNISNKKAVPDLFEKNGSPIETNERFLTTQYETKIEDKVP